MSVIKQHKLKRIISVSQSSFSTNHLGKESLMKNFERNARACIFFKCGSSEKVHAITLISQFGKD